MGLEYRNRPWFASTISTAAGVVLERSQVGTTDMQGRHDRRFRLRGICVGGSTAAAAATTNSIRVLYSDSSIGIQNTAVLCRDPGSSQVVIDGLMGIEGGYIALETTLAAADGGRTYSMWGD